MGRITINVDAGEAGLFHATSPQIPELYVSGQSVLQTLERLPESLSHLWLMTGRESGEARRIIESKEGQNDGA